MPPDPVWAGRRKGNGLHRVHTAQSGKKEEGAAGARKEDWANKHCRLGRGEGGNKGVRLRSITRQAYAHTHTRTSGSWEPWGNGASLVGKMLERNRIYNDT